MWITHKAIPHVEGGNTDGSWKLSAGGRSLDAGSYRLRVSVTVSSCPTPSSLRSRRLDVPCSMARIARMPTFEIALEKIAAGELDADAMRKLALEALSIGDNLGSVESDYALPARVRRTTQT